MAFYADLYGYIAMKDGGGIPSEIVEQACIDNPIFKPCFSIPVETKSSFYVSFACKVKLDEGEDNLWLVPFEMMLKKFNFLNAVVNFLHEESNHVMMYSYVKNAEVQKFSSKLTEQFIEESII